jgi:hypothetical protein
MMQSPVLWGAVVAATLMVSGSVGVSIVRLLGLWSVLESRVACAALVVGASLLVGAGAGLLEPVCRGRPRRAFLLHLLLVGFALAVAAGELTAFGSAGRRLVWPLPLGIWLGASLAFGVPLGVHAWGRARALPPRMFREFMVVFALGIGAYLTSPLLSRSISSAARAALDQPVAVVGLITCVVAANCSVLGGGSWILLVALAERLLGRASTPSRSGH